jgi:hypothetical protein
MAKKKFTIERILTIALLFTQLLTAAGFLTARNTSKEAENKLLEIAGMAMELASGFTDEEMPVVELPMEFPEEMFFEMPEADMMPAKVGYKNEAKDFSVGEPELNVQQMTIQQTLGPKYAEKLMKGK